MAWPAAPRSVNSPRTKLNSWKPFNPSQTPEISFAGTSDVTPEYAEHGYTGSTDSDRGEYRIKQRAGRRVVCWEVNTGSRKEENCLAADDDDPRSEDVSRILSGIADLESSGLILRRFQINSSGDAIGAYGGQWHLISTVSRSFHTNVNS